jgi:hypothetical protein
MAELSNVSVCTYLPGGGNFTGDYGALHQDPATAQDWFTIFSSVSPGPDDYAYSIDPVPGNTGVYTINLMDSTDTIVGWVTVTITECPFDYELDLCAGQWVNQPIENPPTEEGDVWTFYSGPTWFNLVSVPFSHSFNFIAPTAGTFVVVLSAGESSYMRILITVSTDCLEVMPGCGKFFASLIWFNLEGGWLPYIFRKARVLGNDTGASAYFKDTDNVLRAGSRRDVYDNAQVVTGYLPSGHINYLRRLKNSIQAYEYNPATLLYDIPIVIDQGEFTWKEEGSGLYKYNFRYTYATEIIIQNQ